MCGMSATTIKLEADLVKKVAALKPKDESISGFVRELIEKEHQGTGKQGICGVYHQFLEDNPDERAAMEVWESAPLVDEIEPKKP
jgi:predicted CopG family antitoxin